MEIQQTKPIKVNVKTLKLHLKVCDRFTGSLTDEQGETVKEFDCYVPNFMPGEHYGDYVILDIDIDSGMVTNWQTPLADELENFINHAQEY